MRRDWGELATPPRVAASHLENEQLQGPLYELSLPNSEASGGDGCGYRLRNDDSSRADFSGGAVVKRADLAFQQSGLGTDPCHANAEWQDAVLLILQRGPHGPDFRSGNEFDYDAELARL